MIPAGDMEIRSSPVCIPRVIEQYFIKIFIPKHVTLSEGLAELAGVETVRLLCLEGKAP